MIFEERTEWDKDAVIRLFLKHESDREPLDVFAISTICRLANNNDLAYFKVALKENELRNIILPWHTDGTDLIPQGGMNIMVGCDKFHRMTEKLSTKCFKKVLDIKKEMSNSNSGSGKSFILLSSDKELVHPGHYKDYPADSLFIANGFHRLLALALLFGETGTLPFFELFYCE